MSEITIHVTTRWWFRGASRDLIVRSFAAIVWCGALRYETALKALRWLIHRAVRFEP